jgi:uncharacterized iron-regulated protein
MELREQIAEIIRANYDIDSIYTGSYETADQILSLISRPEVDELLRVIDSSFDTEIGDNVFIPLKHWEAIKAAVEKCK